MRSNRLLVVLMVVAASPAWASESATTADPDQIQQMYDRITPAMCLVSYSVEATNPNTNEVSKRDMRALGLLVTPQGLVMAHGHMQLPNNTEPYNVRVTVGQGDAEEEYPAKLLSKPDDINVTFLRVDAPGKTFPSVRFDRGTPLKLGQSLTVLGILGENLDFARSVMFRSVGAILDKPRLTYCLDEPVPFGSVGGPVLTASGKLVGVIGYDLSPEEGGELYIRSGHPLVYQADLFARYLETPPGEAKAAPVEARQEGWLGVFTQPLSDDLAEYWGLPKNGGIVVSTLVAGSPGEKAGMQRGDVIVSFDGTPVHAKLNREVLGFTKLVRDSGVGRAVPIRLIRNGAPMDLQVTLTERPKPAREAEEYEDTVFGMTVAELTTDVRILFNLAESEQGVIVRKVKSGGFADLAQVRPGVIIMNFGGHPVSNLAEFQEAVKKVAEEKPAEVAAFCRVGPRTGFFRFQPRWESEPADSAAPAEGHEAPKP